MTTDISPNASIGTATEHTAVTPLDTTIAEKMSAMLSQRDAQRKLTPMANDTVTGDDAVALAEAPVAPDNVEDIVEPEDSNTEYDTEDSADEAVAPEEVSEAEEDSTASELIDFVDFAKENPNAKFKFTRNGKEVIIDAKKAAAILGQGSAIHEEARELKVQRAEFDEYRKERQQHLEGLSLAMEFTVEPRLQQAYDDIITTQGYQATFQQQLAQATTPAEQARIQAAMEQNNRYIEQQSQLISELKPRVNEFKQYRQQQVKEVIENTRKSFKDKELKNAYVFNEVREKVSKGWEGAREQLIPGIDNIDLISSDEHIMSLVRDGLKYRDRPKSTASGTSVAALTGKKTGATSVASKTDEISKLREQANKGDRKAADNLLMARLNQIRAGRR
jgi:hypothetical protein